jgi:hypothetical protein
MKYGETEYEWQVWDGDEEYALGYAPTIDDARRMAGPYLMNCEGAGIVKLYERREILEQA